MKGVITRLKDVITRRKGVITRLKDLITQMKGVITRLKDTGMARHHAHYMHAVIHGYIIQAA